MNAPCVIVIDNYDSFTFNLVYDLEALGYAVEVYRNDTPLAFLLGRARETNASFVLSPGPGTPDAAGVCIELVRAAVGRFGVLGVCLGHQAVVRAFGGTVGAAREILHGRTSSVHCLPHPLFEGLPAELEVARYHSLATHALPEELEPVASLADDTVMAVAHRDARIVGMQFHPESILTPDGHTLLVNALAWMQAEEVADAALA